MFLKKNNNNPSGIGRVKEDIASERNADASLSKESFSLKKMLITPLIAMASKVKNALSQKNQTMNVPQKANDSIDQNIVTRENEKVNNIPGSHSKDPATSDIRTTEELEVVKYNITHLKPETTPSVPIRHNKDKDQDFTHRLGE